MENLVDFLLYFSKNKYDSKFKPEIEILAQNQNFRSSKVSIRQKKSHHIYNLNLVKNQNF